MYGIFINGWYARAIAYGMKTIETRSRDMLKHCVGQRVALIETGGKKPVIVGYAVMAGHWYCPAEEFSNYFDLHMVPAGSAYDVKGRGKWMYDMRFPERCAAYELPADAIRHGRSWCEFELN